MPHAQILAALRRLIGQRPPAESSDGRLLERFAATRDQEAFAELLRRHGPAVLGLCRRLLGQAADAEDAFQATFLVLARQAAAIRSRDSVAGWLFQVAYRTATRLRGRQARRGATPGAALEEVADRDPARADPAAAACRREAAALVDEELGRLPEKYRSALVLCYLEGQTHEEAARQLGLPLGTLKTRVNRGREALGERLRRRGVELGTGGVAALLGQQASAVVPAALARASTTAAVGFAAGAAGATSEAGQLAQEVLQAMIPTRARLAVVLLLVLALGGAGWALFRPGPGEPPKGVANIRPEDDKQAGPQLDPYGDPVHEGAVASLGTRNFRHDDFVMSVILTPDGKRLLGMGQDCVVRVWEFPSGKQLSVFNPLARGPGEKDPRRRGPPSPFYGRNSRPMVFPDSRTVASVGLTRQGGGEVLGTVSIWDLETGEVLWRLPGDPKRVWEFDLSPDGKTLAVRWPRSIEFWDLQKRQKLHSVAAHPSPTIVREGARPWVAFSPKGKALAECVLVTEAEDRFDEPPKPWQAVLRLLDVKTGRERRLITNPAGTWIGFDFSADDKWLAASLPDRVRLIDVETGKDVHEFKHDKLESVAARVTFSPDGKSLAVSLPGGVQLIDVEKLEVRVFEHETNKWLAWGPGVSFSQDSKWLAVDLPHPDSKFPGDTTLPRTLRLIDVQARTVVRQLKQDKEFPRRSFTQDGKQLVARSREGAALRFWDVATGEVVRTIGHSKVSPGDSPSTPIPDTGMAISPDGQFAALAGYRHRVRLLDLKAGTEPPDLDGHDWAPRAIRFSGDGREIITSNTRHYVWDAWTGKQKARLDLRGPYGLSHLLAGDGTFASRDAERGEIVLRDTPTGEERRRIKVEAFKGEISAFSPDGKTLAARSYPDGTLRLYDLAARKERLALAIPGKPGAGTNPHTLFSPDGRWVAASGVGKLWLWETATGRECRQIPLPPRAGGVWMAFSPDARVLALIPKVDAGAILLEVATGRPRRVYGSLRPGRGPDQAQAIPGSPPFPGQGPVNKDFELLMASGGSECYPAFSPDGRLLALRGDAPWTEALVWDVAKGTELARFGGKQGKLEAVAFSPEGRRLVTGHTDTTALVWDISRLGKAAPATKDLSPKALDQLWADLQGEDAEKAYDAILALASAPRQAVPLLRKHLRPAPPPDEQEVARLLAGLDAASFSERQKAGAALERLGWSVTPALRQALAKGPLETRKRIEELLGRIETRPLTPDELRAVRAAEALERIGTSEARQVLQTLAGGAAGAPATEDARAALRRLARRDR
ncbi:MAG: sigma-70 family RNA polymerase sigma factor [Gemmataceae bacterium]|nr:sigma-70 family RNA polymerase sigma factor [Gemmataceae bacterium]